MREGFGKVENEALSGTPKGKGPREADFAGRPVFVVGSFGLLPGGIGRPGAGQGKGAQNGPQTGSGNAV